MTELLLTCLHGAVLLLFGVHLSVAFSGITLNKKNILSCLLLCAFSGILQFGIYIGLSEEMVWKLYPLLTHLPDVLFLMLVFRKRAATAVLSVLTAYLCCQPVKWFGILTWSLTESQLAEYCVRIVFLILTSIFISRYAAPYLAEIFNKDTRSVCIFGIIPLVYYVFDYTTVVYTSFWLDNNRIAAEFLPFFLCAAYILFCFVYYREYEKKADAERTAQIVRITVEQQAKEIETVRRSEQEIRILRHDLRHFLSTLAVCIDRGETDNALEMISSYSSLINSPRQKRYCASDTVNYVLSNYAARCAENAIPFLCDVTAAEIPVDEILFSSILSNALENAVNAQSALPPEQRRIRLVLKNADGRLLLSVQNYTKTTPVFVDGLPVSDAKGHGYGTQSIRYLTERLGGNCQFAVQNTVFITRVII